MGRSSKRNAAYAKQQRDVLAALCLMSNFNHDKGLSHYQHTVYRLPHSVSGVLIAEVTLYTRQAKFWYKLPNLDTGKHTKGRWSTTGEMDFVIARFKQNIEKVLRGGGYYDHNN